MMKNKVYVVVMAFLVLILAWGCGNEPKKEAEQPEQPKNGEKKILVAPIEYDSAHRLTKTYYEQIDRSTNLGKFVWTDIASLRAMLDKFDSIGQDHVRIYFGIKEDSLCSQATNDPRPRKRKFLTVFFEGARRPAGSGPCTTPLCDECLLDEDSEKTLKPFDILHPCPPPPCRGYSRYYKYGTDPNRLDLRRKPFQ